MKGNIIIMKKRHRNGFMKRTFAEVAEAAGDIFEMPAIAVPGGFSFTVTDGIEVNITGCRAILAYASDKIKVEVDDGVVDISGDMLDISRYYGAEITVRGLIASVSIIKEMK